MNLWFCLCICMYGYVKKKKKKKNWKRIGVAMDINFMCAVVGRGGEEVCKNLTLRGFLFDRNDFVAKKKKTIHFSMHADLG